MSRDTSPGLPALRRRAGTSGDFAATMAARLTRSPALADLTTREESDPTIALVDAWSAVLDVLAFYTERLADESYLRTATEGRSLGELAHSVGYRPGRGRASATVLAFHLEDAAGAPAVVPVPAATRVASLPGPGELPQTYETTADLIARPAWNAMPALARVPQRIVPGATSVHVEGLRSDLAVGDAVLLVGREREAHSSDAHWALRRLSRVQPVPALGATLVGWVDPLGEPAASSGRRGTEAVPDGRDLRLFVLRTRASVFGAAAPDWRLISDAVGGGRPEARLRISHHRDDVSVPGPDWPGFSVVAPGQPENTVDLDATYAGATAGSWVVLARDGVTVLYRVMATTEVSRTDFTLNAKVTRLSLTGPTASHLFGAHVRETTAWVGSELVPLATGPTPLPVQGDRIALARAVPTLEAGRTVVVRGPRPLVQVAEGVRTLVVEQAGRSPVHLHPGDRLEVSGPVTDNHDGTLTWGTTDGLVTARPDRLLAVAPPADAVVRSETAVVEGPTPDTGEIDTLRLTAPLAGCYDRDAVRVLANVAPATHGETRTQVLGSGDAARPYQQLTLAQGPLTYVPTASGGGVASTLEVRVDGRRWREVPQLFGCGPDDEVFTTVADDEGRITVCFGDGRTGARLPSGVNNVTATYRVGTGLAGRLAADVLTMPMTRPLGLRSVTNPLPTGLAADPEPPTEVRANTPRTALTLDRVVSLRDVEDFARAVPGIAKARATWLWDGRRRFVHLTVAGSGGQELDTGALRDLRDAVLAAGDARLPLEVQAATVVPVHVSLSVVVDPDRQVPVVLRAVAGSVTAALSVDARALGQPLTEGDVILAAHAVPGVVAVTVTVPAADVPSSGARVVAGVAHPAQLVVLAPGGLTVSEATP